MSVSPGRDLKPCRENWQPARLVTGLCAANAQFLHGSCPAALVAPVIHQRIEGLGEPLRSSSFAARKYFWPLCAGWPSGFNEPLFTNSGISCAEKPRNQAACSAVSQPGAFSEARTVPCLAVKLSPGNSGRLARVPVGHLFVVGLLLELATKAIKVREESGLG